MDIPYTISGLRKAGLTQGQIGEEVGLKQTSISDMEAGKSGIKRPSYAVVDGLRRLAERHNVPTERTVDEFPKAEQPTPRRRKEDFLAGANQVAHD